MDYEYAAGETITAESFDDIDNGINRLDHPIKITTGANNGDKKYACDLCDRSFNHASNLSSHKKIRHREIFSHVCKVCDRRFAFAEDLNYHFIKHTGEKRFCDQCDKSFSYSSTLKKHKRKVHEKIRAHACTICSKRFYSAFELKGHSLLHTGLHFNLQVTSHKT